MKKVIFGAALAGILLASSSAQAVIIGNDLVARTYATDYPPGGEPVNVLVVLDNSPLPTGQLDAFLTYNQASGNAGTVSAGHSFYGYVLRPLGGNSFQVAFRSDLLTVPSSPVNSVVSYPVSFSVQAGDLFGHFGSGIPVSVGGGSDELYYPTTTIAPVVGQVIQLGQTGFPLHSEDRFYSIAAQVSGVPDGGTTMMLLGIALTGLGLLRRRTA